MKRFLAAILVLSLCLGALAGCGGGGSEPEQEQTPGLSGEYVYVPTFTPVELDDDVSYLGNGMLSGDYYFFIAEVEAGTEQVTAGGTASGTDVEAVADAEGDPAASYTYEVPIYKSVVMRMSIADGSVKRTGFEFVSNDESDTDYSYAYCNCMMPRAEGGVTMVLGSSEYTFDLPENFDPSTDDKWNYFSGNTSFKTELIDLDAEGEEVSRFEIPIERYTGDVSSCTYDGSGNLVCIIGSESLVAFSPEGEEIMKIDLPEDMNYMEQVLKTASGDVAVAMRDNNYNLLISVLDEQTHKLSEGASVQNGNVYGMGTGFGEYDLIASTDIELYGIDAETGETSVVLNWMDCDINSTGINQVYFPDEETVMTLERDYGTGDSMSVNLITLKKTDSSLVKQKTVLTLACDYLPYELRSEVVDFNRTDPDYRIHVEDYSKYNTENDYEAGLTKLSNEMNSGKMPDLLTGYNLPMSTYAARGLLEDLWPLIDADTELGGRDALITPVFDALSVSGGLYQLCSAFSVVTTAARSDIAGDKMGWSFDEMQAALAKLPEGAQVYEEGTTRDTALRSLCAPAINSLIDWNTGECRFDSQEFIDILNFANSFPETFDWDALYSDPNYTYQDPLSLCCEGKQLMTSAYINSITQIQDYSNVFEGGFTFVGYPGSSGNGAYFSINTPISMCSSCSDKEGAWRFMKRLLSEDFFDNNVYQFSVVRELFEKQIEQEKIPTYEIDENGQSVASYGYYWLGDKEIARHCPTDEEYDLLMELINTTTEIQDYDEGVLEIINDACAAFFNGQDTAENAANQVQSRVRIYVGEQG